ncbi:hypothetical protein KY289_013550 [Solanum tuberosum]|nr:hypothetical protein KY289_013550 [Solanum tuberosum]
MALCDHHIFGSGMPYTDPWHCSEMDVIRQFRLRVVDENLIRGKVALIFLSREKERLLKMHLTRCYDMPNIEFALATLRAKVRATVGVETPLYPMARKSEEEFHDLYLAWCDEIVQLKFGIEMLKANTRTQKRIEVDI